MIGIIFLFLYLFFSKKNFYFWCCPFNPNFLELIKIKTTLDFDLNYIGKYNCLDYYIRDKKKYNKTYILSLDVATIS